MGIWMHQVHVQAMQSILFYALPNCQEAASTFTSVIFYSASFLTLPFFSPHLLFQVAPGDDILDAEWNVTIPAGETEAMFQISVVADTLAEADEMFTLELTVLEESNFAVPCGDTATVVIENDGM